MKERLGDNPLKSFTKGSSKKRSKKRRISRKAGKKIKVSKEVKQEPKPKKRAKEAKISKKVKKCLNLKYSDVYSKYYCTSRRSRYHGLLGSKEKAREICSKCYSFKSK